VRGHMAAIYVTLLDCAETLSYWICHMKGLSTSRGQIMLDFWNKSCIGRWTLNRQCHKDQEGTALTQ